MSDTVAAIEAEVTTELTQTQTVVTAAVNQVANLLTQLNSLMRTLFIPNATDLSGLSYPGTTASQINSGLSVPDLPSGLGQPPQADTSITYLSGDYAQSIDATTALQQKDNFIASVMAGMPDVSKINIKFAYQDPLAASVTGDGGSDVIILVEDQILSGVAGYLVLDDSWATDAFNIGSERDAVELERASVKIQRKYAALGYSRPPGRMAREITDAHQAYLDAKAKASRELGIKQYSTSFEFRQAMIASATAVAGEALSHANSVQSRALDAVKSVARFAIDQYNLIVARWQNAIEIKKLPVDVAVENLKLQVEKTTLEAMGAADIVELNVIKFDRDSQKYRNSLSFFRDTLRQFSYQLGLAETNDRVAIMNDEITLKEVEMRARVSLELAKNSIQSLAETMSSEIHAIAAGGKIYSNAIASANGALATLVTLQNAGERDVSSDT
jgi:hypothetical protein